jgi:hypothetical protein
LLDPDSCYGDTNQLDEEEAYDLVTMNIVLHETGGPAEYQNVFSRVRRALKPNGTLLVSELPYPDSPGEYRDRPVYRMLAGVQLHEALVGCGMITQGQLRHLLTGKPASKTRAWPSNRYQRASSCWRRQTWVRARLSTQAVNQPNPRGLQPRVGRPYLGQAWLAASLTSLTVMRPPEPVPSI